MSGPMNPYIMNQYARGLYEEWKRETPENRTNMWRQAMRTEMGPERLVMLKFLRMVEAHQRGEAA